MPHGWRLPARSTVSPRACATESRPAIPPAIAGAVADRTAIDWNALLDRAGDARGRAALQALQRLEALHGQPRRPAVAPRDSLRIAALRLLVLVAAAQTAIGLARAAATLLQHGAIGRQGPPLLLAAAFASATVLLASAAWRDRRVLLLLAALTLASSAFARAVLIGLGGDAAGVLFRGVFPEAFVPAALAQFAVLFPGVQRFTRVDVWARRTAAAAWTLTACLFVANLAIAYGWRVAPLVRLDRDDPGNLFWYVFSATALPAILSIFVRARRSAPAERERVVRLGYALAAGAAPFLLAALARMAVPGVERWMASAAGAARLAVDVTIVGALAAMPVLAALAVIVDRPFARRPHVRPPRRRWLIGTGSLRRRRSRERLAAALEHVRVARDGRELAAVLHRELSFGAGARSPAILEPGDLPRDSALLAVLGASSAPLVLSPGAEPLALLPRREREWLEARDARLAAPLRRRDGSIAAVALLGPRRRGGGYDRVDRWFVSTLLAAAAAAWDATRTQPDERDEAFECERCGIVAATIALPCGCAAGATRALVPRTLAGKFDVVRRLGAGGMGVVYLARDTALGRDVALKTLPARRADDVARLRDEARAMAALNHPSLATIYGLEVWRATPVLVVEYLAGGTLTARLARGPLPRDEIVALGMRMAGALGYMHARGVLHRDLKPGNIGMTADGAMKLLDFGLSAGAGTPAGTAAYLPPEALAGAAPGVAVDLWGLSLVLREAGGDRHPELDAFFRRALAPSRDARFQSSAEIRRALVRVRRAVRARGARGSPHPIEDRGQSDRGDEEKQERDER